MATVNGTVNGDKLFGYSGTDTTLGDDLIFGFGGNDTISALWGNDIVDGGDGNDIINGGSGNDIIKETVYNNRDNGNDIIDGGDGIDTIDYSLAAGEVMVNLATGRAQSDGDTSALIGQDTLIGIENVITGNYDDFVVGNAQDNSIVTNYGFDVVYAGQGNDTINAGFGDDNIFGEDGNDYIIDGQGNDMVNGGSGNDVFNAGAYANTGTTIGTYSVITGNGDDIFYGEAGEDTINYSEAVGGVLVDLGSAAELGYATSASPLLSQRSGIGNDILIGIENVVGTNFNDDITGNELNNVVSSGLGNDIVRSGAGNDEVTAGGGNDQVWAGDGNDIIIDSDNSGADIYNGEAGIDTIKYTNTTGAVTIDLEQGFADTVVSAVTTRDQVLGFENAYAGVTNDTLYGNAGANVLDGGAGNDVLNGRAGDDKLYGGAGNDTLYGDGRDILNGGAGNDTYILTSTDYAVGIINESVVNAQEVTVDAGGVDTIISKYGIDMGANIGISFVENFTTDLTTTQKIVVKGNALSNKITGGNLDDTLSGENGNDNLSGGNGNDILNGGAGIDTLNGGSGNDLLTGGLGRDVLTGGAGADSFKFTSVNDSGLTTATTDLITDFTLGDKIDLSAIDAIAGNTTNDAFTFLGNNATVTAANANGALWYNNGFLYGSTDGDTTAEFSIEVKLVGVTGLSVTDFVL